MDSITDINAKQAKELGLVFRAQRSGGPNAVWMELTFKAAGKLTGFTHVDLHMYDGEKLLLSSGAVPLIAGVRPQNPRPFVGGILMSATTARYSIAGVRCHWRPIIMACAAARRAATGGAALPRNRSRRRGQHK